MRPPTRQTITRALAFLLGVLSLGDQGFHALTSTAHAEEPGAGDLGPQDEAGTCPVCGFFAQAQVLADPPAPAADSPSVPAPCRFDLPHLDRSVELAASPRGPPIRDRS